MTPGKKASTRPPPAEPARRASSPHKRSLRSTAEPDVRALIHELRVHQVELEIQNEELREARLEMEAALSRYSEMFDFAPIGYVTLSTHQHAIVELNHAAAQLLGRPRARLSGRNFLALVAAESQLTLRQLIREAETSGCKHSGEVELRGDDGGSLWVRLSAVALPRSERRVLLALESIAERGAQQQELAQNEGALCEALGRANELSSALAQRLRDSLAILRGSSRALADAALEGASRDAQQSIERELDQLSCWLEDLLARNGR